MSKTHSKIEPSFLSKKFNNFILVTMDDDSFPMRDGVRHLSAWLLEDYI